MAVTLDDISERPRTAAHTRSRMCAAGRPADRTAGSGPMCPDPAANLGGTYRYVAKNSVISPAISSGAEWCR